MRLSLRREPRTSNQQPAPTQTFRAPCRRSHLRAHPRALPGAGVGVVGTSFGGGVALAMAAWCPDVGLELRPCR